MLPQDGDVVSVQNNKLLWMKRNASFERFLHQVGLLKAAKADSSDLDTEEDQFASPSSCPGYRQMRVMQSTEAPSYSKTAGL